ncbi:MAG TPA: hypothetical protein PLE19_07615 [Planctomycetota bacterium]|nr:hypothetical protein [Planctomycetota bacterium]HRR78950.1 hypothetical protein [Planctomycetota bacterium]HRT92772.1 hypothetical protein [Planctomycetota bacterium]
MNRIRRCDFVGTTAELAMAAPRLASGRAARADSKDWPIREGLRPKGKAKQ